MQENSLKNEFKQSEQQNLTKPSDEQISTHGCFPQKASPHVQEMNHLPCLHLHKEQLVFHSSPSTESTYFPRERMMRMSSFPL